MLLHITIRVIYVKFSCRFISFIVWNSVTAESLTMLIMLSSVG